MIDESEWSRVARYLAGECTADEAEAIRRWLEASPERRHEVRVMRALWNEAAQPRSIWDTEAAWQRFVARRDRASARRSSTIPLRRLDIGSPRARWIAVGFTVGAACLTLFLQPLRFLHTPGDVRPGPTSDATTYRTMAAQRALVHLTDGSQVALGPSSEVLVRIGDRARSAEVSGEALFTVVHDSTRPFRVRVRDAEVEDRGTRFDVRAYASDPAVHVLVLGGSVAVRPAGIHGNATVLGPRDRASVDGEGRVTVHPGADTLALTAWTRDRLTFTDASLADVTSDLERWFDLAITLDRDVPRDARVTIDVPAASIDAVLGATTVPLGLRFTRTGRDVVIHQRARR